MCGGGKMISTTIHGVYKMVIDQTMDWITLEISSIDNKTQAEIVNDITLFKGMDGKKEDIKIIDNRQRDDKKSLDFRDFVKQGESIIDNLDDIDKQIVEMQKSEHCYVSVSVIRGLISKLKTEIDDMIHNPQEA
jgi:hypothetical protein